MPQTKNIAIVGAGRIGVASAILLTKAGGYSITIIDAKEGALSSADEALQQSLSISGAEQQVDTLLCLSNDILEGALRELKPYAVLCCTPFQINIRIAEICAKLNCHYVDFTEDISVTKAVVELNPSRSTFVLQTGLAPGLVTSIGKALLEQLKLQKVIPTSLKLRVGALPEVAELPGAYALTWSSAGLINEYYQPVERLIDGEIVLDGALDDHEELIVNGERMEAFNTSGGLGAPSMYEGLKTADYKTLRYPGHLEFLQKRVMEPLRKFSGEERIIEGVKLIESLFARTKNDVVYVVIRAQGVADKTIHEVSYQQKFYGMFGLTALELTTAGTGVAIIELLDQLPHGIVFGGNIRLDQLVTTKIGSLFLKQ